MTKSAIMTIIVALACVALIAGPALAGSESGTKSMEEKGQSMMEKSPMMGKSPMGAVFHSTPRVSKLIGAEVRSSSDEKLGRIDDLVIDQDGRVSYVILAKGGVMGIGADLVAVPISAARLQMSQEGHYTAGIDKMTFDAAPSFASNNWPDFSSSMWQKEVRGYFGHGGPMKKEMKE